MLVYYTLFSSQCDMFFVESRAESPHPDWKGRRSFCPAGNWGNKELSASQKNGFIQFDGRLRLALAPI